METRAYLPTLERFWEAAGLPPEARPYLAFQARRYGAIVDLLAPSGRWDGRRVLDVGGGAGSLDVVLASSLGGSYELAEFVAPSPQHLTALHAAGVPEFHSVDLTRPNPLESLRSDYDLVLFVEVLEHLLVNPLLLFRELWSHLRPGGFLLVTTPNLARLGNRVRLLLGRSIKEIGRYPLEAGRTFGHVVEFDRRDLDRLLWVEGFQPVRHRIVQQLPTTTPSRTQRLSVRLLNGRLARGLELGDDIVALYAKGERPRLTHVDASGRI